jgi:AcrR family transcriptional regulator
MVDGVRDAVNAMTTPSGDGRSRRWDAHRAQRRAELVDAAISAIERHGPEVRTGQIADVAGLPRPKLYRHFDGKADLQRAVVERAGELLTAQLAPMWEPRGSPDEMISAAVGAHLRWLSEHPRLYRYVLRYGRDRGPGGPDTPADIRATVTGHVVGLLTGSAAPIRVAPAVAAPLAAGLVGLVDAAADQWLDDPDGLSRAALTEQLTGWIRAVLDAAQLAAAHRR